MHRNRRYRLSFRGQGGRLIRVEWIGFLALVLLCALIPTAAASTAQPSASVNGQTGAITAPDGVGGDSFGWATAVSGSTALVGAYQHNGGAGAAYVFSSAPWTQQAELTATGGQGLDHFGEAVALDGTTAAIGAPGVEAGAGAVYIFSDAGGTWTQQAELSAGDGASGDHFGQALALLGTTLFVGAPGRASGRGAAYVFTGSGNTWTQQGELNAPDATAGDAFASSLSLSGTTVAIGAPNAQSSGAAYVFNFNSTTTSWSAAAELTEGASGAAGDLFGAAVALDGVDLLVGAPGNANAKGAVYPFLFTTGSWQQQATLTAPDGRAPFRFGISVALSSGTALIGSAGVNVGQGRVYAFTTSDGASWTQDAEFAAHDKRDNNLFGHAVSLSGTTAMIGAYGRNKYQGAGYVFEETSASVWTQQAELLATDGRSDGDDFGISTSLSGNTLVVGAPNQNSEGAAYVYTLNNSTWTFDTELSDPGVTAGDAFGNSVAVSGNTIIIGAYGTNGKTGAAYVYHRSTTGWHHQATLTASDQQVGDDFGYSVALSGSAALVSSFGRNNFAGAVYLFRSSVGSWSQAQELVATDGASYDRFGFSVAISASAAVVGAPGHNASAGVAYFYGFDGTKLTLQSELTGTPASVGFGGNVFGACVAVKGLTAVVGAPGTNGSNHINGHPGNAFVFVAHHGHWSQQAQVEGTGLNNGAVYATSVAISAKANAIAVGAPGPDSTFLFTKNGVGWSLSSVLVGTFDNIYGRSVALSSSEVLSGAPGTESRTGAVFYNSY